MMPWDELVTENLKPASEISKSLDAVREQIKSGSEGQPGPSVMTLKGIEVEVARTFLAASERDLRNYSGLARLSKAVTKGVPTVTVPGEQGGSELLYIFRHPSAAADFRELKVKVVMSASMENEEMPSNSSFWQGQGESTKRHSAHAKTTKQRIHFSSSVRQE